MAKTAIVTGAGSGIGRASALALLKNGYQVALAGRHIETLNDTAEAAGNDGTRALTIAADVTDPAAVKELFARTLEKFGRLDVTFNNAGAFGPNVSFEELTPEQWRAVVDVNLNGVFYCAQEAFRIMKTQNPQGGRIINNGSVSAQVPRPNSAPYTSTKHAVTGLTRSIALDGRKYNIACSQIDIGNTGTDMTQKMKRGVAQADGSVRVEPNFDVKHVAEAVVYIANLPLDANVLFMNIMATQMPFVGRG